MQRSTG